MAIDTNQPFLWGSGGRRLTPEEILLERKEANALGQQAMATTPVGHWSAGLNRVLQGLLSGYDQNVASQASEKNAAESSAVIQALMGQAGGAPVAPITAPAAAPVSTPMGNTSIPAGTIDPRLSEAISGAATANGVDPAYMTRLALVENGGKIDGTSSLSSASGPFQFINSTAKQYGLTNPADPAAAATAAARLTLDNKAALTQALGREPTPGELYLAHQQGAGGAAKLLANPDAPVESVIGAQAARNNGATPGMTAGQFASKWTGKFSDIGAPQVVDANQPSPLDTAQYPAGPVGAPVDGADPAALPETAQAAQGTLPTAQAVQAATQPARPAINPIVAQALTNRYISDDAKKMAGLLFKSQLDQQAKASDPKYQAELTALQRGNLPINEPYKDADGNLVQKDALGKVSVLSAADKAPTSVSEYKFYRAQAEEAGETPLPYSKWDIARKHAGAISVNTGTIPQGYEQFTDPDTGAIRMRAIPGGPKDASAKDQAKADARATSTDVVTNAASLARKAIAGATLPATGTVGNMLSGIGETGAAELNRQVAVLKSNATIENLNAMRAQSPTGGALGNVTEGEGAMLAAKSGTLDPRAPKAQFQRSLDDYEKTLLRIVHGKDAGDKIYEQTRSAPEPSLRQGATATNPKTGEKIILQNGKWVPFS